MSATALLLVAHGSPDPDWQRPLLALADALARQLRDQSTPNATPPVVQLAYLGFIAPSIDEAVATLYAAGHRDIVALSAFLSPGGKHIKRDVPQAIATAARAYPDLRLQLRPGALGADPSVVEALATAARIAAAAPSQ